MMEPTADALLTHFAALDNRAGECPCLAHADEDHLQSGPDPCLVIDEERRHRREATEAAEGRERRLHC